MCYTHVDFRVRYEANSLVHTECLDPSNPTHISTFYMFYMLQRCNVTMLQRYNVTMLQCYMYINIIHVGVKSLNIVP